MVRKSGKPQDVREVLEDTQARLEQMSFLSEISAAASSSLDLQEVLAGIAGKMAQFFEVGHCGVVVREPDGERMYVAAEYPDRGAVGIEVATGGYPVAEIVMQQGQILAVEDAQNDPRMGPEQEWARELDVQSALFIPLVAQDEVIGSIGLDAVGQPRHFTEEEIALAQAVAAQIGMAVQNARLFASVEAQMKERERLHGELVEAQQRAIKELSTPIIPIFDRVIALPLIGSIDTMRVRDIMLRLLEGIDKYQAGVVGYQMPRLRGAIVVPIARGDTLVVATDGIRSEFAEKVSPGDRELGRHGVQRFADGILARYGKDTDDALVLVVRYVG